MKISKKKATIRNVIINLVYQFIVIFLGFIIPKLFLDTYGPNLHGLTSAINNIISYVLLLNAGLNMASTQALYKPLNSQNIFRINQVFNAIRKYYLNTGIAIFIAIFFLAILLPFIVKGVPNYLAFSLMLVMGLQSTVDCFLISKYRILLHADQKLYIQTVINIVALLLRGFLQIILMSLGYSIIVVQLIPTIMLFLTWSMQRVYINKHYKFLNKNIKPDKTALSKRWSALVHQIAGVIVNNVDTVLITLTGNLILVSIYSVYQLVFSHLYNLMTTVFSQGTVASFGHLMANKNLKSLRENYDLFEVVYYMVMSIVYSVTAYLILPFVNLYSKNVDDINYVDSKLALLFIIIALANNIRIPGVMLINAGGYYRETQLAAIIESIINLVVSVILLYFLGIYGVLLGTVASFLYRTTDIVLFSNKKILKRGPVKTIYRSMISIIILMINFTLLNFIVKIKIFSWIDWIYVAIIVGIISVITTVLLNAIFNAKHIQKLFLVGYNLFKKSKS